MAGLYRYLFAPGLLTLTLFLFPAFIFAQTGNSRLNALLDSARQYIYSDNTKAYSFIAHARKEAVKAGNPIALAYSFQLLGILDEQLGDHENALKNYLEAIKTAERSGSKTAALRIKIALSNYYLNQSEFKKCIEVCHKGIRESLSIHDNEITSQFYNNLSLCHSYMNDHGNALKYSDKSIELKSRLNNEESLANAYLNKGLLLTNRHDYAEGFRYYSMAESLYIKHSNHVALTQTYINFAWDHTDLEQPARARAYLGKAMWHARKSNDKIRISGVWNAFGYYYQHAGYADSVVYALESGLRLAAAAGNKRNVLTAYQELGEHYRKTGNTRTALDYYIKAWHLRDTILNEARQKLTQSLNARYESLQKEEQIKLLNAQKQNDRLVIQKQRWAMFSILLLVMVVFFFAYVFFARYRKRQKTRKKQELQEQKEAERMRIARDMHDEIGGGLTRMVMRSAQVRVHLQSGKDPGNGIAATLEKMESESKQLSHNLGEIIWALNPKNDTLDALCAYMRSYAYDYLEEAGISCRISFPGHIPGVTVSPELRRNIFLIVKESLNNLVKHSGATEAEIMLELSDKHLSLMIKDNGKGVDTALLSPHGNGLSNMKMRTEESGGQFVLESGRGKGTAIHLIAVPFQKSY